MTKIGKVTLVGAGPGDADLLTVKALRALREADVVIHDRLVSREILACAGDAELIDVGKRPGNHPVPQAEIEALLIASARAGKTVVRLKGGDPFIFGRGHEELDSLRRAGISCTVIPGITAAQGAAASAGIPLTHRGVARSVRFITGHCRAGEPLTLDWAGLADPATTLVVYMGLGAISGIARKLIAHGLPATTPALAIASANCPGEQRLSTDLAGLAGGNAAMTLPGPVLFIIGKVAGLDRAVSAGLAEECRERESRTRETETVHA